mmetsp:Transcript_13460/g.37258  ORF Transcript_13460/g.37258 Transcript_13460/m.37258 type:complete len:259 (+) Transcript_13460:1467-2243(+)
MPGCPTPSSLRRQLRRASRKTARLSTPAKGSTRQTLACSAAASVAAARLSRVPPRQSRSNEPNSVLWPDPALADFGASSPVSAVRDLGVNGATADADTAALLGVNGAEVDADIGALPGVNGAAVDADFAALLGVNGAGVDADFAALLGETGAAATVDAEAAAAVDADAAAVVDADTAALLGLTNKAGLLALLGLLVRLSLGERVPGFLPSRTLRRWWGSPGRRKKSVPDFTRGADFCRMAATAAVRPRPHRQRNGGPP